MFFVVAMSVWTGGYLYVGFRLIGPSGLAQPHRAIAWASLALLTYIGPLVLFGGRITPKPDWYPTVSMVGYSAMGVMSIIVALVFFRDLGSVLFSAFTKVRALTTANAPVVTDPARRQFFLNLTGLCIVGSAFVLAGAGYLTARRRPRIVRADVPLSNLAAAFQGFRIALLSDLHLGASIIRRPHVEAIVQAVNAEKPDMIAVTGDLADGYPEELRADSAPLSGLSAHEGKFFVTGNHEYYWALFPWLKEVKSLGFNVLDNEHRIIRRGDAAIVVAGVPDSTAASLGPSHAPNPEAALRDAPAGAPRILLAHKPRDIQAAQDAGVDLQLSGHTHGGQFWPWTWVIYLVMKYVTGLHRVGRMWLYVNPGTGTWGPPMRLGMPGEITILTLRRG